MYDTECHSLFTPIPFAFNKKVNDYVFNLIKEEESVCSNQYGFTESYFVLCESVLYVAEVKINKKGELEYVGTGMKKAEEWINCPRRGQIRYKSLEKRVEELTLNLRENRGTSIDIGRSHVNLLLENIMGFYKFCEWERSKK